MHTEYIYVSMDIHAIVYVRMWKVCVYVIAALLHCIGKGLKVMHYITFDPVTQILTVRCFFKFEDCSIHGYKENLCTDTKIHTQTPKHTHRLTTMCVQGLMISY